MFILISCLGVVFYLFLVLVRCLFCSSLKIGSDPMYIQSMMTLILSTLQIRMHRYSAAAKLVFFLQGSKYKKV